MLPDMVSYRIVFRWEFRPMAIWKLITSSIILHEVDTVFCLTNYQGGSLSIILFLEKNEILCVIEVSASNRLFLLDYAFCTYQIKLCAIQPIDNKGLQTRYIN